MNREEFSTRKLEKSYLIQVVSGDELDTKITKKITFMIMIIQNHQEALIFDIVEMIIHNIILEMPWLKLHNSDIDWEKRVLTFERCNCVIDLELTHRQRSMMNEKQMTLSQPLCSTEKIDFTKKIVSTVTVKSLMRQEVRKNEGIHAPSDLEKSSRSKNRAQKTPKRPPTPENILDKYDN